MDRFSKLLTRGFEVGVGDEVHVVYIRHGTPSLFAGQQDPSKQELKELKYKDVVDIQSTGRSIIRVVVMNSTGNVEWVEWDVGDRETRDKLAFYLCDLR